MKINPNWGVIGANRFRFEVNCLGHRHHNIPIHIQRRCTENSLLVLIQTHNDEEVKPCEEFDLVHKGTKILFENQVDPSHHSVSGNMGFPCIHHNSLPLKVQDAAFQQVRVQGGLLCNTDNKSGTGFSFIPARTSYRCAPGSFGESSTFFCL